MIKCIEEWGSDGHLLIKGVSYGRLSLDSGSQVPKLNPESSFDFPKVP